MMERGKEEREQREKEESGQTPFVTQEFTEEEERNIRDCAAGKKIEPTKEAFGQ